MYLYNLHGYEENTVFVHAKYFTQEEFNKICKSVELGGDDDFKYYNSYAIEDTLIDKYGFEKAKYQAGFFIDGDVEQ